MQPEQRDAASLVDMVRASDKLERYLSGKTLADLLNDEMVQDAVVRQFTILGEAGGCSSGTDRCCEGV